MERCCANCKNLNEKMWCKYQQDWIADEDLYKQCCSAWKWNPEVDDQVPPHQILLY